MYLCSNSQPTFLSTPSARRATEVEDQSVLILVFLSTPSARRATVASNVALTHTVVFLSTPSARRATDDYYRVCNQGGDFYPRPPRGGRQAQPWALWCLLLISIHALREEGDPIILTKRLQSIISIHALREEGD